MRASQKRSAKTPDFEEPRVVRFRARISEWVPTAVAHCGEIFESPHCCGEGCSLRHKSCFLQQSRPVNGRRPQWKDGERPRRKNKKVRGRVGPGLVPGY